MLSVGLGEAGWLRVGQSWLSARLVGLSGCVLSRSRSTVVRTDVVDMHVAGLKAFFTTPQLSPIDKAANALALGTSPIVRSLVRCT